MVRAQEPRVQFNLRLPPAVLRRLEKLADESVVEKQMLALAALVGFELMNKQTRLVMTQFARRVAKGEVKWDQIVDMGSRLALPESDRAGLVQALNGLVNPVQSKPAKRRQA